MAAAAAGRGATPGAGAWARVDRVGPGGRRRWVDPPGLPGSVRWRGAVPSVAEGRAGRGQGVTRDVGVVSGLRR